MSSHPSIPAICRRCGAEFLTWRFKIRAGEALYCGNACRWKPAPLSELFWKHVLKTDTCWIWQGSTNAFGYGKLSSGQRGACKTLAAHRVSWEIHNGPIPEGLQVHHNCPGGDNPTCVHPEHLWLGTQAANMNDMVVKGRSAVGNHNASRLYPERYPRGENHHQAKWSDKQVQEIRHLKSLGISGYRISKQFAIPYPTVKDILRGKTRLV